MLQMKTLVALFALVLCFQLSYSQPDTLKRATNEEKAAAVAARMEQELALSPAQTKAVQKLVLERIVGLQQSAEVDKLSKENTKALAKLENTLTKQQVEKYKQLRQEAALQKEAWKKQNKSTHTSEDDELDF
jgi:translation initiation factor 2 gamma subunit (eIF-2gamma)